jgi:hypothetical protein
MAKSVVLDEKHYEAVLAAARAAGQTPEEYLHALIDARMQTFDELLAPVRKGFESVPDDELDALFSRAQKAARHED